MSAIFWSISSSEAEPTGCCKSNSRAPSPLESEAEVSNFCGRTVDSSLALGRTMRELQSAPVVAVVVSLVVSVAVAAVVFAVVAA
eukprot:14520538-Heterocapsa_arctica.AAC.1